MLARLQINVPLGKGKIASRYAESQTINKQERKPDLCMVETALYSSIIFVLNILEVKKLIFLSFLLIN